MLNLQIIYRKYHFIGTFRQEGIVASHWVLVFTSLSSTELFKCRYNADTHRVGLIKIERLFSIEWTLKETQLHTWWLLQRTLKCLRYVIGSKYPRLGYHYCD